MTGAYRITATRVLASGAPGTWMLHLENLEAKPGFRSVAWSDAKELGDLREKALGLLGAGGPILVTLDVRFVLPPEIEARLDRARDLVTTGAGPRLIERELDLARRDLAALGLSEDEVAQAVPDGVFR